MIPIAYRFDLIEIEARYQATLAAHGWNDSYVKREIFWRLHGSEE